MLKKVAVTSLVLLALLLVYWPHLAGVDRHLIEAMQAARTPLGDRLVGAWTHAGDFSIQLAAAILLCLYLLWQKQTGAFLFALSSLAGTALANQGLKTFFERSRPDILHTPLSTFSFPSGHTSASFALFLVMAVLAASEQSRQRQQALVMLAIAAALSIALSRVYLGVHWPTDILAGALLGISVSSLSLLLIRRYHPLQPLPGSRILLVCLLLLGAQVAVAWALPSGRYLY